MKKKQKLAGKFRGNEATTTAKDWGFFPVPGKGGRTTNSGIGEGMIHRELKEKNRK